MERDFLGAIGSGEEKGSAAPLKEEISVGRAESDYLGGAPAKQWQFPVKAGAASSFMSFSSPRDEESRKGMLDHYSFSGHRPPPGNTLDGIKKHASHVMPHLQRQFGFNQVSSQQYAAPVYGHHAHGMDCYGMDSYGMALHHPQGGSGPYPLRSIPGSPMLRVQSLPGGFPVSNTVSTSTVGVYGARDLRNPMSTQMTIFYNGSVNVFDNVPVEKAQQLMLLANRASIPSPPSAAHRSDLPIPGTVKFVAPQVLPARQMIIQKPESSVPGVSGISSPIPAGSQEATRSKSTSSSNNDTTVPKYAGVPLVVTPVSQVPPSGPMAQATTAAAAINPRAVPQSRKASLARFLEKRKERVSSTMPYPSSKSPLESSSDALGSTPSKSSCTDIAPSSNHGQESISPGESRNISFGSEKFPSTKLQI